PPAYLFGRLRDLGGRRFGLGLGMHRFRDYDQTSLTDRTRGDEPGRDEPGWLAGRDPLRDADAHFDESAGGGSVAPFVQAAVSGDHPAAAHQRTGDTYQRVALAHQRVAVA